MKWEIKLVSYELNQKWKIAGCEISHKDNYVITLKNGENIGHGELGLSSRDSASIQDLEHDLAEVEATHERESITSFQEFSKMLDSIDFFCPEVRFAVESAFLDYLHSTTDIEKWRIIGTNTIKSVESMCSVPIFNSSQEGQELVDSHPEAFVYKFKISKETIADQLEFLKDFDKPIVLDGNESWGSDYEGFVDSISELDPKKVLFIEQPLDRYSIDAYKKLKSISPFSIFVDESLQNHIHLDSFTEICDGVVIKAIKAGTHMKMVTQMTNAKKLGLKTVLGCMVESSVGISSLFSVAYGFDYYDLDGFTKIKNESHNKVFWDKGKVILSDMN